MSIQVGYECEYFVEDKKGNVLRYIPGSFPTDAMGDLVEVRSMWYPDPDDTLTSFLDVKDGLEKALKREGLKMIYKDIHDFGPGHGTWHNPETAGFHIHFSRPDGIQMPMPLMMDQLTARFKDIIGDRLTQDSFDHYRMKSRQHKGWEYRLLPASVDVKELTKFLKSKLATWETIQRDIPRT